MQLRTADCKINIAHCSLMNSGQTDINKCKITKWKERLKNGPDWEKSIKETKVHIGL